jgi:hypothetical protein
MIAIAATSTRTISKAKRKIVRPNIPITAIISAVSTIVSVKEPPGT